MHFQPVIALADGSVHAFEALARWRHPRRGLLSASEFIPVAEESGQIIDLGRETMQAACAQAGTWLDAAPAGRHVGVWINVSPAEFGNERLVEDLAVAITSARIDPQQVTVEVTESSVDPRRPPVDRRRSTGCAPSASRSRSTISARAIRR